MLRNLLLATLNLMLFRAGPQDLPYAPQLTRALVSACLLASYFVQLTVMPPVIAAATAAATVCGLGLATMIVLRARKLEARYTQTFHALLVVTTVMTVMLWPVLQGLAPDLIKVSESMGDPAKAAKVHLPAGPVFLLLGLVLWNFAVNASIFRQAADISVWRGVVVTMMVAFALQMFAMLFMMVATLFTGVPAAG